MDESAALPRMLGESSCFLEMQEHISLVAPLNKPVLIVGERGTGKELVASRLHFLSRRWDQNFLKINCAAVSETLLEAQLFGHEAGAYTGATKARQGFFERADGGTLFLDELANTALPVQEKILRIIEYGEFERLGGNQTIEVNVRIIGATNEDLPGLAAQNRFREDLLDRLAFDVITLPPLRVRTEDILILAEHFAMGMVNEMGGELFAGFTGKVEKMLMSYDWPGNVRELKNVIERAVYQHGDQKISELIFNPFDSPYRLTSSKVKSNSATETTSPAAQAVELDSVEGAIDFKESVQNYEIDLIKQAMEKSQFNQKKAAELLGLSYHQLRGYLRKYDLLG